MKTCGCSTEAIAKPEAEGGVRHCDIETGRGRLPGGGTR
jgi:hypothetical protein